MIFQANEVVMITLGFGTLIFITSNMACIRRIPAYKSLLASFFALLLGWVSTILEELFLNATLNFVEHLSYAVSAIFIAIWCWQAFASKGEAPL